MKFKKKDIYAISEKNIKILKDGHIKIHKGVKYPLEPFISDATDNTVCLPIDNIINQESIVTTKDNPDIVYKMTTMANVISIPSYIALYHSKNIVQTVVATTTRKLSDEIPAYSGSDLRKFSNSVRIWLSLIFSSSS